MYKQITQPGHGLLERHHKTLPPPPTCHSPSYPILRRVLQWPSRIAFLLEWCSWRHDSVLIGIQCLITWCGGLGVEGTAAVQAHISSRNPEHKVKIWSLCGGLLGSVLLSEHRAFAHQLKGITASNVEPCSPLATGDLGFSKP